ncbi:MAG: TonB-dependent receptor, partial [Gammaproteobacteria bacterium]|nr:TonB-dependent receptor [Gammaproteobacteria bacterium]
MGKRRTVRLSGTAIGLLVAGFSIGSSQAQTTGTAGGAGSGALEEVIVTATKRVESIQDVPVSITALSSRDLEAMGAEQFFDYGNSIPNLSFGIGASDGNLAARGIALRGIQGSNTTGFYIDDTPVVETLDPHIVDIARIEVLRGPQGTLYGAESMGGTLRVITEQPNATAFSGDVHVNGSWTQHGSFNELVEGVANIPLVTDTLALRASAFYQFDDGYFDKGLGPEAAPPTAIISHVGSLKYYGGQIALRYQPTSDLAITPRIMYQRTNEDGDPYAYNFASNLTQREVFNLNPGGTDKWYLASLTINYTQPWGSFVSSTAGFNRKTFELEDDTDVTAFDFALAPPLQSPITRKLDLRRFAEEIRFASSFQGPFQILLGGFYSDSTRPRDYEWTAPGIGAATGLGTDLVLSFVDSREAKEQALFGDASYEIVKDLKATVGLRWFKDQETFHQYTNGIFFGGAPSIYDASPISATGYTPKYLLEYKATPDVLLYTSAAKGFREGGANIALPPGPPPTGCDQDLANIGLTAADVRTFTSDDLWNYEAGFKSSFAEHRVTLNMTGFWIEWDKIQQLIALPLCGYGVTGNSGRARSQGVELEFSGRLASALTLGVGFGYENARITEKGAGSPQTVGSPVYMVPRVNVASNLEYTAQLSADWSGFARADYAHVGGSYSANNITPQIGALYRPAYSLAELRLGGRRGNY